MQNPAALFPGQGSQEPGMGRALAEGHKEVMDLWKQAERACKAELREIYWDGDEAAMADTRFLQPALTVVNIGLWTQLAPHVQPLAAAGHSLGEFSALAAAQVLPVGEILELVTLRGQLMANADPEGKGAMAAVLKLPQAEVEELVREAAEESGKMIVLANLNSPQQFVISGEREAVERLTAMVQERKARAIPLKVSGAFHSPLMAETARELAKAMDKLHWSRARFPVVCNATATAETEVEALRAALEVQATSKVRWIETMRVLWEIGSRTFVEIGPKNVLSKLAKPNLEWTDEAYETAKVDSPEHIEAIKASAQL